MLIKYKVNNKLAAMQSRYESVEDIKELIQSIEDKPVKEIHAGLINNLKQSIISLESCDEPEESEEKERYMEEIN